MLSSRTDVNRQRSIKDLWHSAPGNGHAFDSERLKALPGAARQYLQHAIARGTTLATAVRLRMHGEIKLKSWYPFSAEQVICWDRGMIWQATVRVYGVPIRGGDAFVNGRGSSKWKLLGILPLVNALGPDIARSAAGRVNIESIWLPSALCGPSVSWTALDAKHLHARFTAHGERAEIDFSLNSNGGLNSVSMPRWGNPKSTGFGFVSCGGFVDQEATFAGYTIPARMRIGWHFGTERFASEKIFPSQYR